MHITPVMYFQHSMSKNSPITFSIFSSTLRDKTMATLSLCLCPHNISDNKALLIRKRMKMKRTSHQALTPEDCLKQKSVVTQC